MQEITYFNPLHISPIIFHWKLPVLGIPLEVRWYGVMYLIGYVIGFFLLKKLSREKFCPLTDEKIDSFIAHLILGMVLGARIIYCLVYDYGQWIENPMSLLYVWQGGLSFHGAVIGMSISAYIFARKNNIPFIVITDAMALAGAPGLFFGRMGNFINGELYGRVSSVPWAMIFPAGGMLPRHPSMLYEGLGEGILLTLILWFIKKRTNKYGVISGSFLLGYGMIRFLIENVREADPQLGYYLGFFTMGQFLCLLMIPISMLFFKASKTAQRF